MSQPSKDYYQILEVHRNATEEDIKKAYKKLALLNHPDRNRTEEAEERFKEISEAYTILINTETRLQYDRGGGKHNMMNQHQNPHQHQYQNQHQHYQSNSGTSIYTEPFSQYFNSDGFFTAGYTPQFDGVFHPYGFHSQFHRDTRSPPPPNPIKDPDITKILPVTLEELYHSCVKTLGFTRKLYDPSGASITIEDKLDVYIEAGSKGGKRYVFPEVGDERHGNIPADLVIILEETAHRIFERQGNDLLLVVSIPLKDALCGVNLELTLLDGPTTLFFDGVAPGEEKRISKKGMPVEGNPDVIGDLIIRFNIIWPNLSPYQKEQLLNVL